VALLREDAVIDDILHIVIDVGFLNVTLQRSSTVTFAGTRWDGY
jgi:hypothetical protein